jgi:hypothetical protein
MLSPEQRSLRARIGAFAQKAQHDPRETTARAREAFLARFLNAVDPDGLLSTEERQRRAEYARRAHMARLALASSRARSAVKQPKQNAVSGTSPETAPDAEASNEIDDASTSPALVAV